MILRYDLRPVSPDANDWGTALSGRAGKRAVRLSRLRGGRLAEALSAECLLKELVTELDPGIRFLPEDDEYGRPFLPGLPYYVSISHSGGIAAAAVSDIPVGIDLQSLRTISPRLLDRCYSKEEITWIGLGEEVSRAIRLWTMKEAYGKLRGTGIFAPDRFFASFTDDRIRDQYADVRFLFPPAPSGFLFTVCTGVQASDPDRLSQGRA